MDAAAVAAAARPAAPPPHADRMSSDHSTVRRRHATYM
jgi:hypothetical protein